MDDVDVGLCDRVDDLNLGPMDQMVNNAVDLCSNLYICLIESIYSLN